MCSTSEFFIFADLFSGRNKTFRDYQSTKYEVRDFNLKLQLHNIKLHKFDCVANFFL